MAEMICPHVPGGVTCDGRRECDWCGWNPAVSEKRPEGISNGKKPEKKREVKQ